MKSVRIRTGYSFRAAAGNVDECIARLVELGYTDAPITDRASTFGYVKWTKACKKNNLRPVYGVELAVSPDPQEKKPIIDHWAFIATDEIAELNRLVALATFQFRYEPLLSYEQALSAKCQIIIGHKTVPDVLANAITSTGTQGQGRVFYALGPAISKGYARAMAGLGIAPVAASDNRYALPARRAQAEILLGRGMSSQSYEQHILSEQEWRDGIDHLDLDESFIASAISNSEIVLRNSVATIKRGEFMVPEKPKTLHQMCVEGAAGRNIDLSDPVYAARLKTELGMIEAKEFEDYIYLVADLVNFAKTKLLVGPGRGSSAGSLVCYLIGITDVDPIPYGLIFERFIDMNRGGWFYKDDFAKEVLS